MSFIIPHEAIDHYLMNDFTQCNATNHYSVIRCYGNHMVTFSAPCDEIDHCDCLMLFVIKSNNLL